MGKTPEPEDVQALILSLREAATEARGTIKDARQATRELRNIITDIPGRVDQMIEKVVNDCMAQLQELTLDANSELRDRVAELSTAVISDVAGHIVANDQLQKMAALASLVRTVTGDDVISDVMNQVMVHNPLTFEVAEQVRKVKVDRARWKKRPDHTAYSPEDAIPSADVTATFWGVEK